MEKKKKKTNKFIYTIFMIILVVIISDVIVWGYGSTFIYECLTGYPKGGLVIQESITAVMVLVVVLLFKNSYIFTQKKEKTKVGLFYGLFYIILSSLFLLLFGFGVEVLKNYHTIVNLLLACTLVGITEEFLCRGWLLNEFLERFGDTKKGIWYSIIISGLIFGCLHFGNIMGGQSFAATIIQVLTASASGIVFGLIYYKTKNIWSVVILHGLWDFSIMLGDVSPSYVARAISMHTSVVSLIFSTLLVFAELLIIIPYIKDIDNKPKKKTIVGYAFLAGALYLIFFFGNALTAAKIGDEYVYGKIKLDDYTMSTYVYDEYTMVNNNTTLRLKLDNKKLFLINEKTGYKIGFDSKEVTDFIIVDDNDRYILAYIDYIDSKNIYLKYTFITKNSISDSDEFLNSVGKNMNNYLIPDDMELMSINSNGKTYLCAYEQDHGYYLLTSDKELSILER